MKNKKFEAITKVQPSANNKIKAQLHVRENSKDELDALFDPVKFKITKPLNKRNLPDSFFKPPEKGTKTPTHSRQSSIDSTLLASTNALNPQNLNQQIHKKILNQNHLRSNSEPVLITSSFSLAQQNELPLPPGWESAVTPNGQRYFIKYIILIVSLSLSLSIFLII